MHIQIATFTYIAMNTPIPVPAIYAWDTDAANPVGAEWMIMQKVRRTSVLCYSLLLMCEFQPCIRADTWNCTIHLDTAQSRSS